jgi:transposase-like protein
MTEKAETEVDWPAIWRDYVAGELSVREIARRHGVSHTAINKKVQSARWARPTLAPVGAPKPAKAAKVKTVEPEVAPDPVVVVVRSREITKDIAVEAIPDAARALIARMLVELDALTANAEEIGLILDTEERDPRRRQALLNVLSLAERTTMIKTLTTAIKTLNDTAAAPKPAEQSQGKKAQRQEASEKISAGGGRFSTPPPPPRTMQ